MHFDITFGVEPPIFEVLCPFCGQVAHLSHAVVGYVRPDKGIPWRPGLFGHRSCLDREFQGHEAAVVVFMPALEIFSELVWQATTPTQAGEG
jgi:hypothetical protein